MRRQIAQRARRKRELRKLLIGHQLLPADADEQGNILSLDPYVLRAKGLDQPLSAYEFGRVLLHLAVRGGFCPTANRTDPKPRKPATC